MARIYEATAMTVRGGLSRLRREHGITAPEKFRGTTDDHRCSVEFTNGDWAEFTLKSHSAGVAFGTTAVTTLEGF